MQIYHEEFTLQSSMGERFCIDVRYKKEILFFEKFFIVIICPGFMAFKDWGPFPYIGEKIAEQNYISIVMNYSHNGIDENKFKITNFEKFASNTITKELNDIRSVINWSNEKWNGNPIILVGHSRGAANAIIIASENEKVKGLITISSISHYDRWTEHQKNLWIKEGFLYLSSNKLNPLKMSVEYFYDLQRNKSRYDIINAANQITVPWLIVHGGNDIIAKVEEAYALYKTSNKNNTEIEVVKHMGHLLGYDATNAIHDRNNILNNIINKIMVWLEKKLKNNRSNNATD